METFWTVALWNLVAVSALMTIGWVASLLIRNVSLVDSLWGLGFVLIAGLTLYGSMGYAGRAVMLTLLVAAWGLRLSAYLTLRNWGRAEDPRYAGWRQASGSRFWFISLFKVFLLQALFLWVIALSLQYGMAAAEPARLTLLDLAGLLIWLFGFAFETVADRQLARFKADPANRDRVMRRGLWALSRHPNYFGEALMWWGIFTVTSATPGSIWTVISPVVITTVLLRMTGIPLTEKHLRNKRPEYRDYIATTNAFFPWFPKTGQPR